jgi:quinoprotein glucose dehydrogenase
MRSSTLLQPLRHRLLVVPLAIVATSLALTACPKWQNVVSPAPATSKIGNSATGVQDSAVTWPAYGRDAAGTKYSPAAHIVRANVGRLIPVWTYRTGDFARGDGTARDETTPLYVDGALFASTPFGGVRALDGETGRELWRFDSELDLSAGYGDPTNRGVSTWLDTSVRAGTACARRIYVATLDARLIALDSRSGAPCAGFGIGGQVDLRRELRNAPEHRAEFAVTSPPAVIGDAIIVGSAVADNQRAAAPSGVVRAYDARTGALRWAWDPVPRDASDSAYSAWSGDNAHTTGAANAWSIISADPARDLVFVPTGSASPDFFGGERLGRNDYANSVVAIRASTGKVVWHFQVVHHDLWDYDVPAEPALVDIDRGGQRIPALVQGTKMGYVYVLNRETGEPLFPVTERPAPASDVPGEEAWPTQPAPSLPAPLGPTHFDVSNIFALSDSSRAWCRATVAGARNEGIFTPPSVRGTIIFPGNIGGSNWSGVSIDPVRQWAIVPSNRIVTLVQLIARDNMHERMMGGTRFDEFAPQTGTAFALRRRHLIAPDGVPCNQPPWGVLTAIDLRTGATLWEKPFGRVPSLSAHAESATWGAPNLGGAMVTAGGLVFAAGAVDQRLYAFDEETGAELWSAQLPAGVHGSPMTYVGGSGKQFVVVAAGGHRELRDPAGDYIVAFALADDRAPVPPERGTVHAGKYVGHITLDRSRFPLEAQVTIDGSSTRVEFRIPNPVVVGAATGRSSRDSVNVEGRWAFDAQSCGGTIVLHGVAANHDNDLIGELEYFDGCADQRTKPGTFALRRAGK